MNRRELLSLIALVPLARSAWADQDAFATDSTEAVFGRLMSYAVNHQWVGLPIGELMGKIGMELRGTPYVAGTLEKDGPEACRVNLTGLDCVTFFEDVLCIARILKKGSKSYADLVNEITFTRYRDGKLDGYLSRLHYTAEWISNNVSKGVVKDVTPDMGGIPLKINVSFMSKNPKFYPSLVNNPDLVNEIAFIERLINNTPRTYIPKASIAKAEPMMQTGDIIAVATSKAGLDYAHTGMIFKDEHGEARLLHASTVQQKVVLDKRVSEYVGGVTSHTGITVVRPVFES
jgi:hypothetical protein